MALNQDNFTLQLSVDSSGAVTGIKAVSQSLDQFNSSSDKASQSTQSFGEKLYKTGESATFLNQSLELAKKAYDLFVEPIKESFNEYIKAESANQRLQATLSLTSKTATESYESFKQFTEQLEKTTLLDDPISTMLLNQAKQIGFTDEETKKLIATSIDLAAVTNESIEAAFNSLLGTYKGVSRGVALYAQEVQGLTADQLRAGGAVDIISKKFQGQGQILAGTLGGQIKQTAKSYEELSKSIGAVFAILFTSPSGQGKIQEIVYSIKKSIDDTLPALKEFRATVDDVFKVFKNVFSQLDFTSLAIFGGVISTVIIGITQFSSILPALGIGLGIVSNGFQTAAFASLAFAKTFIGYAGVITGIGLIVSSIEILIRNFDKLGTLGKIVWEGITIVIMRFSQALGLVIGKISGLLGFDDITKRASDGFEVLEGDIQRSGEKINELSKTIDTGISGKAINGISNAFNSLSKGITDATSKTKNLSTELKNAEKNKIRSVVDPELIKKASEDFKTLKQEYKNIALENSKYGRNELEISALNYSAALDKIKVVERELELTGQLNAKRKVAIEDQLTSNKRLTLDQKLGYVTEIISTEKKVLSRKQELEEMRKIAIQQKLINDSKAPLFDSKDQNIFDDLIKQSEAFQKTLEEQNLTSLDLAKQKADQERVNLEYLQSQLEIQLDLAKAAGDFNRVAKISSLQNRGSQALESSQGALQKATDKSQGIFGENGSELTAFGEISSKFSTSISDAVAPLLGAASGVGQVVQVLQGLVDFLPSLLDSITNLFDSLTQLPIKLLSSIGKLFDSIINYLTNFTPNLVKMILGLLEMIPKFLFEAIPAAIESLIDSLPILIESLIDGIIKAIPKIIAGLGTIGLRLSSSIIGGLIRGLPQIWKSIWDAIPEILKALGDGLIATFMGIFDIFTNLFSGKKINPTIDKVVTSTESAQKVLGRSSGNSSQNFAVENLSDTQKSCDVLSKTKDVAKTNLGMITASKNFLQGFWDGIKNFFIGAGNFLKDVGTKIWDALGDLLRFLGEIGQTVFKAFFQAINWVFEQLARFAGIIWDGFSQAISWVFTQLVTFGSFIWEGLKTAFNTGVEFLKGLGSLIWDGLKAAFNGATDFLGGIGKSIWDGFVNGIKGIGGALAKVLGFSQGGLVQLSQGGIVHPLNYLAMGGNPFVPSGTDTIPAMLTPGEFVINRQAASSLGINNLSQLNRGSIPQGSTENNFNINLNITNSGSLDENFIRTRLVPSLKDELKRASLDGQFVISSRGIR